MSTPPDRQRAEIDAAIASACERPAPCAAPVVEVARVPHAEGGTIDVTVTPGRCATCGQSVTASVVIKLPFSSAPNGGAERALEMPTGKGNDGRPGRRAFSALTKSPIGRDPQLAEYILQCRETLILSDVRKACVEKFGLERAPSRSAINRFLLAVRKEG